jgi:hypothetical protein
MKEPKNLNELAVLITKYEGGVRQVDIAQVKEVMKVMAKIFVKYPKAFYLFFRYMLRVGKRKDLI